MTGHFTSYENRTDHELATPCARCLSSRRGWLRGLSGGLDEREGSADRWVSLRSTHPTLTMLPGS